MDDYKVTIVYPYGNTLDISRSMIMEAIHKLQNQGCVTLEDVHYQITNEYGSQTVRLLAVQRELSGVTFTSSPRALYLDTHSSGS